MSNKELAAAVSDETGDSVEHIEAVIRVHQQRFPASWQDWTLAGKTPTLVKIMTQARKDRETAPERIVSTFG
jgi:hypothetical protein